MANDTGLSDTDRQTIERDDFLVAGYKGRSEKRREFLQQLQDSIGSSSTRKAVLRNFLIESGTSDLFQAWPKWQYSHKERGHYTEGRRRQKVTTGKLYGRELVESYWIARKDNPDHKIPMGETLYTMMRSDVEGFDRPPRERWDSPEKRKERRQQKQGMVDQAYEFPEHTLEDILRDPAGALKNLIKDKLGMALDGVREYLAQWGVLARASPYISGMKDPSENLVALQKPRGLLSLARELHDEGRMPEHIMQLHYDIDDDVLSATPEGCLVWRLFMDKHFYAKKSAILNGIDSDLELLQPKKQRQAVLEGQGVPGLAPVVDNLVEKYGTADLSGVAELMHHENISFFDAARFTAARPDILDIREDGNRRTLQRWDRDIGSILRKARTFYETDKLVLRQELRKGRKGNHLYSRFLNSADYRLVGDLLWKLESAEGEFMDNFMRHLSLVDFYRATRELYVLGARVELAERLAEQRGIDLRTLHSVPEDDLQKIEAAARLNANIRDREGNLKYCPLEEFEQHPDNRSGMSFEDVMATYEEAGYMARQNSGLARMVDSHFRRIRMFADVGIFHVDDVKRLNDYIGVAKAHVEVLKAERQKGLGYILSKAAADVRVMLEQGKVAVRRIMGRSELEKRDRQAREYETLSGEPVSPERLAALEADVDFLKSVVRNCRIYSGAVTPAVHGGKGSFAVSRMVLEQEWQKDDFWQKLLRNPYGSGLPIYDLDKVADKADEMRKRHVTLVDLCSSDPVFRDKLDTLVDAGQDGISRHFRMYQHEFADLQSIAGDSAPDSVYLSRDLVLAVDNVYNVLHSPLQEQQYTVCVDVLGYKSRDYYNKVAGKPGVRYNVFIPGGNKGRPNYTFDHQPLLRRTLKMGWNPSRYGYERKGIDENELGRITTAIHELNNDPKVKLQVLLTR